MQRVALVGIPTFVRIKPGALERLGVYLARHAHRRVVLVISQGLAPQLVDAATTSLAAHEIALLQCVVADDASYESASASFAALPGGVDAVVGLGGGKALDVAKYVAFLAGLAYYAVPTSLSNDGFCSPQSSLWLARRRRSLAAALPFAVVVDTAVCLAAPELLWLSGVGDLVAKVTAVYDWKLAYRRRGEAVDDFAALLSDASVYQFLARPQRDLEGIRVLATALMLNGIAMAICGSSRPASGAEHLISHALDEQTLPRRAPHGMQVGTATYLVSHLQGQRSDQIGAALEQTGFWRAIRAAPFSRAAWLEAVRKAPQVKPDRWTILSERDCTPEIANLIDTDPRLAGCFEA